MGDLRITYLLANRSTITTMTTTSSCIRFLGYLQVIISLITFIILPLWRRFVPRGQLIGDPFRSRKKATRLRMWRWSAQPGRFIFTRHPNHIWRSSKHRSTAMRRHVLRQPSPRQTAALAMAREPR